jgi:hypothetical protein
MSYTRIPDPETGGFFTVMEVEDFEYANPIEQTHKMFLEHSINFEKDFFILKKPPFPINHLDDFLLKRAEEKWLEEYKEITSSGVHENLLKLLDCDSKKEQIKLLKGLSFTSEELMNFIFCAWEKYNYSYSKYHSEHSHTGLDESQLPTLIHKKSDSEIISVGKTNLSDGQMKQLIEQRSVKVSKFLDKGDKWHCLFLTYKSLGGDETGGQPHLHYISNYWGLTREYVVQQLCSKNYKLPSLPHIDFYTHRNPKPTL